MACLPRDILKLIHLYMVVYQDSFAVNKSFDEEEGVLAGEVPV
jgi:hypothetical protein